MIRMKKQGVFSALLLNKKDVTRGRGRGREGLEQKAYIYRLYVTTR